MTDEDRIHWDERYARVGAAPLDAVGPPPVFAPYAEHFPNGGHALELACGRGRVAVWLATRGINVWGVDISSVAVDLAKEHAIETGVGDRCRFDVVDLDLGLPVGPPVDLIMCHWFRDPRLDKPIIERLAPGGLLAIRVLSEVGAGPGRFRARPRALLDAFAALDIVAADEGDGEAWLLATAPT
jgi:SAM-dependent methyltransferase